MLSTSNPFAPPKSAVELEPIAASQTWLGLLLYMSPGLVGLCIAISVMKGGTSPTPDNYYAFLIGGIFSIPEAWFMYRFSLRAIKWPSLLAFSGHALFSGLIWSALLAIPCWLFLFFRWELNGVNGQPLPHDGFTIPKLIFQGTIDSTLKLAWVFIPISFIYSVQRRVRGR